MSKTPHRREVELSDPIMHWLKARDYTAYCEIKIQNRRPDIVAVRGNELISVELKTKFSEELYSQLMVNRTFSDKVYCGIFTEPIQRNIRRAKDFGIGILRVEGSKVNIILEAKSIGFQKPTSLMNKRKSQILDKLTKLKPGGTAGIPTLTGHARTAVAHAREYQRKHPEASWEQIYRNVPNHFPNYNSFCNAMYRYGLLTYIKAKYVAAKARLYVQDHPDSDHKTVYDKMLRYHLNRGVKITSRICEEVDRHRAGIAEEVYLHRLRQYLIAHPATDWENLYTNVSDGYRPPSMDKYRKFQRKWRVFSTHPLVPDI